MKRMYIGAALLIMALAAGIAVTVAFSRIHLPIAQTLDAAAEAALEEDWVKAAALRSSAEEQWQRHRHFTAALADHEPLEQIDGLFARLRTLEGQQDAVQFAGDCAELSRLAVAMAASQGIAWWDLL